MTNLSPAVLGFAAYSGTGKTTLLTKLIPLLKNQGLHIGVIKHTHHNIELDRPGKDSFELRSAGATPVMLVSPYRRILISESPLNKEPDLAEQLALFPATDVDLILVEGFRHAAIAKIELHRPSMGKPLLYPADTNIIALASDTAMPTPAYLPNLDLNNAPSIAKFILCTFLGLSSV